MTNTKKMEFAVVSLLAAVCAAGVLFYISSLGHNKTQSVAAVGVVTMPITEHIPEGTEQAPAVGNFGYIPKPEETARFLKTLQFETFAQASPDAMQKIADGKTVVLYRPLLTIYKEQHGRDFVVGRQGIGDCVSWGFAHAADFHLAIMYELGDTAEFKMAATEAIYGGSRVEARGGRLAGYSDGSYGAAAAKFISSKAQGGGGILFRQKYPSVDLTTYSASRAKDWGNYGCGGQNDNGELDAIAAKHPIQNVTLVTNFEEAAAAIASGYPIAVCSGQGFSSKRDSEGFCAANKRWAHCMCFIGVRFDRKGLLCLNSWGPDWVSGPKYPDDMLEGSFWIEADVVDRMLAGRDSFAVSGYVGFPFRDLSHTDWVNLHSAPEHSLSLAP